VAKVVERPVLLEEGATVAIVGGGPAGAFSAIHLITQARAHGRRIRVLVFERNCQPGYAGPGRLWGPYAGCPQCAGGVSPRLHEAMEALGITLSPEVIQSSISSITVQGNWKSIILPVPRDRKMFSVYRGTLPFGQHPQRECFDAMMLGVAVQCGAELIGSRVFRATYNDSGGLDLAYMANGLEARLTADFVVFAGGVNEKPDKTGAVPTSMGLFQQLQPEYVPPRLRKALIFELETLAAAGEALEGELHFIESSSGQLRLDMCSILSKRGYITVTLIGKSVDESVSHQQNLHVIRNFLALPQIHRALPPHMQPRIRCICNPSLVVGTANRPFGQRIAAVGDMATSRQYKDGILSAHNMAESLARAVFDTGIDEKSLEAGYGPIIAHFQRDNRYATVIFFLYRWFFTSPFLSRIIYQTFASEKKARPEKLRTFKKIFWAISSGDGAYEDIAWAMVRPSTLWLVLWGGVYVTLRNWLGERFFGLDWHGLERVPTAVSRRELKAKRVTVLPDQTRSGLAGRLPEFECMYTVHIRAAPEKALAQLAKFGEQDRPYLNPRWVKIRRTGGEPLCAGSVIQYTIFGGLISFSIEQQPATGQNLIVYRVSDGFAHGGAFVFEVEPLDTGYCDLTVYLAFDYARGDTLVNRVYWRLFKLLFPEFIHDVLWNHALCEIKHRAEEKDPLLWDVQLS
jgi:hypothetical protein